MSTPCTPLKIAEATGRTLRDPKRYRNSEPDVPPIGTVPEWFTLTQMSYWVWAVHTIWWLRESDRPMVETLCVLWSKVADGSISDAERNTFVRICALLGLSSTSRRNVIAERESPDDDI